MKSIFLLIALINLSITMQTAKAGSQYCEWVGEAATVIAENRANGMSEFDLIENYLNQNQSYPEQQVIIPLVERIYAEDQKLGPSEIAVVEQLRCELA